MTAERIDMEFRNMEINTSGTQIRKIDVVLTGREIGSTILEIIRESLHSFDDCGCDYRTDNSGQTWVFDGASDPISKDPNIAALVDAMNVLFCGHTLKKSE